MVRRKNFIKSSSFLPLIGVAWLLAVGAGLGYMASYQATPGVAAAPSVQWPNGSHIQLATDRATLLIMAHPQCPCTRSTIGELNTLMARTENKPQVYVLFLKPKNSPEGWEKTDLWRSAASIPNVKAITDVNGVEARRFHASTSGQTFLFNSSGHLLFSGGITAGRGHAGENAGSDAIVSFLNTGTAKYHQTSVFGCSLGLSRLAVNGT